MRKIRSLSVVCLLTAAMLSGCGQTAPAASTTTSGTETKPADTPKQAENKPLQVSLAVAGDTVMTDLMEKAVAPDFKKKYEGAEVAVVGTGPGDAGSQKIVEKLKAQKDAGKKEWDIDVAIVHQNLMKQMIDNDLLDKWVPQSANKQYVTSSDSKNSLGTNVEGYVIPMFHSQVAIAYNPDKVKQPPASFEELAAWIQANPKRFGYNGIKNGMSGVAFTTAYVYWKTGDYKTLSEGPYNAELEKKWPDIMKELKSLPATITNGNNGTLDMLNRGEIDMGPVWVDMFYTWIDEGRLNPNLRLKVIEPGLPGQPMYVVITKNAKNKEAALAFADFLTSPEIQAKYIVDKNSWYPGIDANAVMANVSEQGKQKLFKDVTAEDLSKRGQSFPISQFFTNLQSAYEKN
ncbi:extracellular solute-binding protein [Paenibacillus naphthalenovorans]|uniref:ABC transporter substrate-binding protein n=1 Tax=Paenibacillus naphthalenovorans TaxID=162209 RepID=A0A0U2UAN1_9BACL|nr:extracellular solute-binding protein [Paenibacillus naphthalenovorans]ALS23337.1 ABC transporter substrate-binding protein [Paenibacillus naphthalenovorans]